MKHEVDLSTLSGPAITRALSEVKIACTEAQSSLLLRHAQMVVDTNRVMNLTRITDADSVLKLHIVDSLAFLQYVEVLGNPVLDLGSGAGYPGIPLAVMGYDVVLCESVQKKARFLQGVVQQLSLESGVEAQRVEELTPRLAGHFSTVVARAVAPLASLIELSAPVLRVGGRLIALKGMPSADEAVAAHVAATQCGMKSLGRIDYSLPSGESRTLFVYERVGKPAISLPRRTGLAQSQPIGGNSAP